MITELTPQQEAAISFYQQKWQKISRSTEPIDRDKAITALNDANDCHGGEPFLEIAFFDSPCAAFNAELEKFIAADIDDLVNDPANILDKLQRIRGEGLTRLYLYADLESCPPWNDPKCQILYDKLADKEGARRFESIWIFLENWLKTELHQNLADYPEVYTNFCGDFMDFDNEWLIYPGLFDFCINELNCDCNLKEWKIYEKVLTECGCWFLPGGRHWLVCDRPCKILFDEENNLHAEGEPAIEYSDGFALYAEHGIIQSMVMLSK
jgi:hypothetical protein